MTDDLDDIEEPDDLDEEILRSEIGDVIDDDIDIDDLDDALVEDIVKNIDEDEPDDDLTLDDGDLDDDDLTLDDDVDGLADAPPLSIESSGITSLESAHTDEDDEEETGTEDVEEALDMILRTRVTSEDDDIIDSEDDIDDDTLVHVVPRQPDEFVCQSCFLLKNASQLADPERGLCKDCV